MAERIKKTPLKQALEAMNIVWQDASDRLHTMDLREVLDKMPGAIYYNSSHPFRDKLHIEGIQKGLEFALTGSSGVVEFWMKRAAAIKVGEIQPPTPAPYLPPSKFKAALIGLRHGLGWRDAWRVLRSRTVKV